MIVDDEDDLIFVLDSTFKGLGYETLTANSGEEALENLKRFDPGLVITDHDMPGISGVELAKKVKNLMPETKIMLYTANESISSEDQKIFYRIFQKPVLSLELVDAVKSIEKEGT